MKKINGQLHYFGRWGRMVNGKLTHLPGDGWKEALEEYEVQREDLYAGRTPRVRAGGLTVMGLCNHFLTAKHRQYEEGELSARMYKPGATPETASGEYKKTTDQIIASFGGNRLVDDLTPEDFGALRAKLARRYGPVRLGNEVQRVRTLFKYGYETGLIDKPMRYGPQFVRPSKSVMRRHRAKAGMKLFEADELRVLIDGATMPDGDEGPELVKPSPALRAMILLGLNAGFGNTDCASLPLSALDLERGWVDYPRPKTGIARRCPLWPETLAALRAVVADRPKPAEFEGCRLVFINERGSPWVHIRGQHRTDNITVQFGRLVRRLGIHRGGTGFYSLRHTFRTVADAARDPVAIDLIMGHTDPSMGAAYRERIDDARLLAVANAVRAWLWPDVK